MTITLTQKENRELWAEAIQNSLQNQLVEVSDYTLKRGFRELFNTTVFGYLNNKRMEQAEQLLRGSHLSVAEVANLVGYSHQGHFAAAFKRKFGITPSECLLGKNP